MDLKSQARAHIKKARKRGAKWVRLLELARLIASSEGRSILWTLLTHGRAIHQTSAFTCEDRYPELFDFAASLIGAPDRILSFGCSTGEELVSLRRRFPAAEIVGAEMNPRSRRLAKQRTANDGKIWVISPNSLQGKFDMIFALAVLQREPHRLSEAGNRDISSFYPFAKFDAAVCALVAHLRTHGILCVMNTQYRIEDSSAALELQALASSPLLGGSIFAPDGRPIKGAAARSVFRRSS